MAGREQEKLTECEAFLRLFLYVKNQIQYFLSPTRQIFATFRDEVLEESGFLPLLRAEAAGVYHSNWADALDRCSFSGDAETKDVIREFGEAIGKSNRDMQIASFDYYIKLLTEKTGRVRSAIEKNTRLYRAMGFALGAAVAILLL